MEQFTIQHEQDSCRFTIPGTNPPQRTRGQFIYHPITAFYHADYQGGRLWQTHGSIENMIWTLKNDVHPFPERLPVARHQLWQILLTDLPQIRHRTGINNLTVCVIPRSKREDYYRADQKCFRQIVSIAVRQLPYFIDGTGFIIRHTDTRTTHLDRNNGGGAGDLPYPGITMATCNISPNVANEDILLIDDLYTRSVNIDEDAIQALLNSGARTVIFYAIGKTVYRRQPPIVLPPPFATPPQYPQQIADGRSQFVAANQPPNQFLPAGWILSANQPQPNNPNRNNNDDLPF